MEGYLQAGFTNQQARFLVQRDKKLKDDHSIEIKKLKDDHSMEIKKLRDEIKVLRGQLHSFRNIFSRVLYKNHTFLSFRRAPFYTVWKTSSHTKSQ